MWHLGLVVALAFLLSAEELRAQPLGIREQIERYEAAHRHEVRRDPQTPDAWIADNPEQRLGFVFDAAGVRMRDGGLALSVASAGRPDRLVSVAATDPHVEGNRVEYRRGVFTEWYVNDARGLEQGFTFSAPPAGDSHELAVALAVPEEWELRADADGRGVALAHPSGARLAYRGLHAFDAAGRDLPARVEARAGEILLVADAGDAVYPVTIDPILTNLEAQLFPLSPDTSVTGLGHSVSLSGDTLVAGAGGAAYVFTRSADTGWEIAAKLLASDVVSNDGFGPIVAMSGDVIVVSAELDDDVAANSGSAYVFVKPPAGWSGLLSESAKLRASDAAADDEFGNAIAISGDTIAVAAELRDDGFTSTGAVYVFVAPAGGWSGTRTESARLHVTTPAQFNNLGRCLAMEGNTIVACASDASSQFRGAAYVFLEPETGWAGAQTESAKLKASDPNTDDYNYFAQSVAISGNQIAVGDIYDNTAGTRAGSVRVFVEPASGWSGVLHESAKLLPSAVGPGDAFGSSVDIDAGRVVAGAFEYYALPAVRGAAFVIREPAGGWSGLITEAAELRASNPGDHNYGLSVAISGDTVVVGAEAADRPRYGGTRGSAYIFEQPAVGWSGLLHEDAELTNAGWTVPDPRSALLGFGTAAAGSGDTLVIGGSNSAAYVFQRTDAGAWEFRAKLIPFDPASQNFGSAVAIDGDTVVVTDTSGNGNGGAVGAAYVYREPAGGWFGVVSEHAKLRPSNPATVAAFGWSVAIEGDTIVVGVPYTRGSDTSQQGKAYVFIEPAAGWSGLLTENARLTTSNINGYRSLGTSLDIEDGVIVTGAPDASERGLAYLFVKPVAGWANTVTPDATLSSGTAFRLGYGVAISEGRIAVGASPSGAVYVYARPAGGWSGAQTHFATLRSSINGAGIGTSLVFSGRDLAAGAPSYSTVGQVSAGAAVLFHEPDAGWSGTHTQDAMIMAPDFATQDFLAQAHFGSSLVYSGSNLLVGASGHDGPDRSLHRNRGTVYAFSHAFTTCSNGALDAGESCDDGNLANGDCCSSSCQIEPASTVCRAAAGSCDVAEACDGVTPACPADARAPAQTECRAAAGVCDVSETCDGAGAQCPADAKRTGLCRGAAAICDVPEFCNGSADACPLDGFVASGNICRGELGACDLPEYCSGATASCPADVVVPDGSACGEDDACRVGASCNAGRCEGGAPTDCDDQDPCTAESCDAVTGCAHTPIPLCGGPVPAAPWWAPALLSLGLLAAGAAALRRRAR